MSEMKQYPPGTFCWVELATSDARAAKAFYGELLEWNVADMPAGGDMIYSMLKYKGKEVAGLFEITAEMKSQGIPPHWLSYVSVASVDETATKAKSLGGKVIKDPFDVMDVGRMAVVQDPTHAVFALWQPKTHQGAALVNETGAFCWNELLTTDTAAAEKFYTGLFGWTAETAQVGPMPYTEFKNGERPAAGMLTTTKKWATCRRTGWCTSRSMTAIAQWNGRKRWARPSRRPPWKFPTSGEWRRYWIRSRRPSP